MADFTNTQTTITSVQQAASLLNDLRSVYGAAKAVQAKLALYQANTDSTFNATINAMFNLAQRTEISDMLADVNALAADWEANHASAIGLVA